MDCGRVRHRTGWSVPLLPLTRPHFDYDWALDILAAVHEIRKVIGEIPILASEQVSARIALPVQSITPPPCLAPFR